MSGKVRQRTAANPADSVTVTVNEKILKECHSLYIDPENGLVKIAESLGLTLLAPRKKITVLMIGNHSAGKSSFINWYVEEHVQRTGVAIETQGFTFVTSGRKRESLTGNATLHLYPHFEPLRSIAADGSPAIYCVMFSVHDEGVRSGSKFTPSAATSIGVTDYLTTEISTSKQKKFSLVTFVDTPGLVDGDMSYPFDVNEAICWLGDLADLIFVFFDPIGQALCKRTLNLVEKLNEKHADRIKFYLSKADEAGHESDRQRVMMQIVQELCKRPGLNRTGFDMPTIYIPNPSGKPSRCANQIEDVCKDIEKTINQTIQNTLNTLEKDCEKIAECVDVKLAKDSADVAHNFSARTKGVMFGCMGILLPALLALNFLASSVSKEILSSTLGRDMTSSLLLYLGPVREFWRSVPVDYHLHVLGACVVLSVLLLLVAKYKSRSVKTLSRKQKRILTEEREYVQNVVKAKKQTLYADYLKQSVAEHDL